MSEEDQQKERMEALRELPSVDRLLATPEAESLVARYGRTIVRDALRESLDACRSAIRQDREPPEPLALASALAAGRVRPSLRPVLNATGVVLHTNLGRAPLAAEVARHAAEVAASYASLELDLATGARGSRQVHVGPRLAALVGAEAALVVNNGAAAVLLVATALAAGREVVVSRGELVEIGGKFRVPEVLVACGARLVEVGTTNRTRADDYARAMGPGTALLLKVHRSNFALVGFTEEVTIDALAALASREPPETRPVLVYDLGSGALGDGRIAGVDEPTVRRALADGADLVCFSGDKLLGGPQAGVVVGRASLIERLGAHPLMRALRPGKLELAALEATVALHGAGRVERLPTWRALRLAAPELREAADRLLAGLGALGEPFSAEVVEVEGRVGGGASPLGALAGSAVAVRAPARVMARLEAELRAGEPPLVARVEDGALLLDPRTLLAVDDPRDLLALAARLVREAAARARA